MLGSLHSESTPIQPSRCSGNGVACTPAANRTKRVGVRSGRGAAARIGRVASAGRVPRSSLQAVSGRRTLWEEGRRPGRLVALSAGLVTLIVVLTDVWTSGQLTALFDVAFVLVCLAAALAVRPRDFFVIGVYPPLLMAATLLVLAITAPGAIADPRDGAIQAVISGLAHHATALVTGYILTLVVLALRNVAIRNAGALRKRHEPRRTTQPIS